jgi:hypothetical protein
MKPELTYDLSPYMGLGTWYYVSSVTSLANHNKACLAFDAWMCDGRNFLSVDDGMTRMVRHMLSQSFARKSADSGCLENGLRWRYTT